MTRKRDRRHDNPGRPPTIGADARVEVRLPSELLEAIKKQAHKDGLSVSEWLRRLAESVVTA